MADDLRAKLAYELTEWKHRLASWPAGVSHRGVPGNGVAVANLLSTSALRPPLKAERDRNGTTLLVMSPPPDADGLQVAGTRFVRVPATLSRLGTGVSTRSINEKLSLLLDAWMRWVDGPYFTLSAATFGDASNHEKKKIGRPSITFEDRKESKRVVYLWKLANRLGMRKQEFADLHNLCPGLDSHTKRLPGKLVRELSKIASSKAKDFLTAVDRDDLSVREVAARDGFDDVLEAGVEAEHVERVVNSSRKK